MPELYLASTSTYRQRLLADAGITVACAPPGVDERAVVRPDPTDLARTLAAMKARAVADQHPDAIVIGADQVGYALDPPGAPFGKPDDPEDHFRRLKEMVGRRHALVTGVAIAGPGIDRVEHETSVLTMRSDVTDDELRAYVATGEASNCAGGYAVDGRGLFLFDRIEGDWTNVIGLPIPRLLGILRELGWRFPGGLPR